jgi:hypothetical protein
VEIKRWKVEDNKFRVLERIYTASMAGLVYSRDIDTPFSMQELKEGFHQFYADTPLHLLFKDSLSRMEMLILSEWIDEISAREFLDHGVYLYRDMLIDYAAYLKYCSHTGIQPKIEYMPYREMFGE